MLRLMDPSTSLIVPALGPIYACLAPWAEALLRAVVGLWLIPHALRNTFGLFPTTGIRSHNLTELAAQLDKDGYRPGKLWAPAISLTQFIAGPLLALGLFTRPAAFAILCFLVVTNFERWRVGKYFWNQLGLEYTLMWTVATFYFLIHGGGRISLDHLIGRAF
jgi:putative oxidoreductase